MVGASSISRARWKRRPGTLRLSQHVSPGPPVRRILEVGGVATGVAQYLQVFPVVALSGADRELIVGGPHTRRTFLDRFSFLLENSYFNEINNFNRTLRQRNAALITTVHDREMEVWEARLAQAAAAVVQRRRSACERLLESFTPIYGELQGEDFPEIDLSYRGEPGSDQAENVPEVEEYYRKRYNETRARDRRTGFTSEGPQRHDLVLRAEGRSVRHMLSSGQTKVVAAALRLASLKQIERERGEYLPVIIDDVDAELDEVVLSRLVEHLEGERQLFLSSADGEVFDALSRGSRRHEIHQGTMNGTAGERTDE